jgi:hypothetical protein
MKIHKSQICYVYFCFIILLINSCGVKTYAQSKKNIDGFFEKEKLDSYTYCLKSLEEDEEYKYLKNKNDTMMINLYNTNCLSAVERYDFFKMNSLKLVDSVAEDNKSDFVIINIILQSLSRPNPVLTVIKFKNENRYSIIHNDYAYDENKQMSYRVSDSSLAGYKPENNFKELEAYFYNNIPNDKIFEIFKEAEKKYNDFNTYYIVVRVSGKIITKKLFFADHN